MVYRERICPLSKILYGHEMNCRKLFRSKAATTAITNESKCERERNASVHLHFQWKSILNEAVCEDARA